MPGDTARSEVAVRVLILYDCLYPESAGGVEHRNLRLARELGAMGHSVTLAGFGASQPPEQTHTVLRLGTALPLHASSGRRRLRAALRYAVAAARLPLEEYDVVETASVPFAHLWALQGRCRRRGIPLVVTWHECWGAYWRTYLGGNPCWRLFALAEARSAKLGDRAIAPSRLAADRLAELRGEVVRVVPGGIDVAEISRVTLGAAAGCPVIYAGRLIPEKRVELLVRAAALLELSLPKPWIEIVGTGPERERLEGLAMEKGVSDRLRFRGALQTTQEVWRQLGAARVAVQPSAREGFGLFPLEAMAAGLPVVHCASSESAVREIVRDGVEGVEAAADPASLAAAISHLLGTEDERARLAANARRRACEFAWSTIAGELAEVFTSLFPGAAASDSDRLLRR